MKRKVIAYAFVVMLLSSAACGREPDTTQATTPPSVTPSQTAAVDPACTEFANAFSRLVETLKAGPPPPAPLNAEQQAALEEFDDKVRTLAAESPSRLGTALNEVAVAATRAKEDPPAKENFAVLNEKVDKIQSACGAAG